MKQQYKVDRKSLAEAKIGQTLDIYIKELKDCHRHTVRVVHVGMMGQVVHLLNHNDTIMYTVKVKSHNQYTIRSIGQLLDNEITCNSGEHGIHVKMSRIHLECQPERDVVKVGDILKGTVTDDDYEVRFVEGKVLVTKHVQTGNLYSYDNPAHAKVNYKTMEFEA